MLGVNRVYMFAFVVYPTQVQFGSWSTFYCQMWTRSKCLNQCISSKPILRSAKNLMVMMVNDGLIIIQGSADYSFTKNIIGSLDSTKSTLEKFISVRRRELLISLLSEWWGCTQTAQLNASGIFVCPGSGLFVSQSVGLLVQLVRSGPCPSFYPISVCLTECNSTSFGFRFPALPTIQNALWNTKHGGLTANAITKTFTSWI